MRVQLVLQPVQFGFGIATAFFLYRLPFIVPLDDVPHSYGKEGDHHLTKKCKGKKTCESGCYH